MMPAFWFATRVRGVNLSHTLGDRAQSGGDRADVTGRAGVRHGALLNARAVSTRAGVIESEVCRAQRERWFTASYKLIFKNS